MLYAEKLKNDEKRVLKRFKNGIVISRGGFGRKYIIFDNIKALLPKDIDVEKITSKKAEEIIKLAKSKKKPAKKSTSKRKTKK